MKLVECVPNFSEGRRPKIVARIRDAIAAVDGVADGGAGVGPVAPQPPAASTTETNPAAIVQRRATTRGRGSDMAGIVAWRPLSAPCPAVMLLS